ncbi:MAG: hypothetical protein ACLQU1_21195 [Bryobacteraceae bacterium]
MTALPARDIRISRRSWLLAGLAIPLLRGRTAESLHVSFDGDNLHVAAPGLHFLTGKPLERLRDAATVVFLSQLTVYSDDRDTVFRRFPERIIVSYDLWEEKFAVSIPGPAARSKSHMVAAQAEAWVIDGLAVSALGIDPNRQFWLKFELRTADRRELSKLVGDTGISVSSLIEMVTRQRGLDDSYWSLSAGPLRLVDLPRTGRGTRNG